MVVKLTPIVGSSTRRGVLEFKVCSCDSWVLDLLRFKLDGYCRDMGMEVEQGW